MSKRRNRKKKDSGSVDAGMNFEQKILKFLKARPGKSYTKKELSHALGVSKQTYSEYQDSLYNLLRKGKIVRLKGRRYTMPSALQKIRGIIQVTRRGFGFVTDERTGEEIFVPAPYMNTAFDGDLVEVQLFAVSRGKKKEGEVVEVLQRNRTSFVGTFHKSEYYGFVVPDNPRVYRDFYVQPQNQLKAKDGQKVVVELVKWDKSSLNPVGKITEIIGYPDEPGVDVISVVKGHNLETTFPPKVVEAASRIRFELTPEVLKDRLDLREEITFTIDPPDARDFDDAVSLTRLENNNYRLGVHIADVSHFVQQDSIIDKEALKRATSIYLVDRVIPMLPEKLSNELCSLQPHKPRLTFSCIMEISPDLEVVNYQIAPSVIHSKRRYTYEEVQDILEGRNSGDEFAAILKVMNNLAQALRKKRMSRGSIDFETPEVRFILDERGKPKEIVPVEYNESHQLIEEFMLMANQTVAKYVEDLKSKYRIRPFIYRVHERPDAEKLEKFQNFLNALGFRVRLPKNITPAKFGEIMASVLGGKDDILIKEVALRTMMKANYSTKNIGHFGLAFTHYTHFTSPIRRYPDLEVHRMLKRYLGFEKLGKVSALKERLNSVSEVSSRQERVALEAERESVKIKQVEWIADYVGEAFEGLISGVTASGLFVEITPQLIEGFIPMENLHDDYYLFDEKTYSLVGKESNRTFRLGDAIKIRVKSVNRELNQVDFVLDEEY